MKNVINSPFRISYFQAFYLKNSRIDVLRWYRKKRVQFLRNGCNPHLDSSRKYLKLQWEKNLMPKNVVYTTHAEDRIRMRNISKKSIDKAFSVPDETID